MILILQGINAKLKVPFLILLQELCRMANFVPNRPFLGKSFADIGERNMVCFSSIDNIRLMGGHYPGIPNSNHRLSTSLDIKINGATKEWVSKIKFTC